MDYVLSKAENCLQQSAGLNGHLSFLKRKLMELNSLKEDVESRKLAELRPGKKLKKQVENWFVNVEGVNGGVQNLEDEIRSRSLVLGGLLGQEVLKKTEEVEQLIRKGSFADGLVVDEPAGIGQMLPPTDIIGDTIKQNMENVWELLMNEAVGLIGVYGMGGVGKTTIMKQINNQLLNKKDLFDIVMWITVSKEFNIFKLQSDIAKQLRLDLSKDEDQMIKAGKLFESLDKRGRFVIILDDLWHKLSIEEMGIPKPLKGSKLVITSRSLEVCRYMNCETIEVRPLQKEEAWDLFLMKVGRDILNNSNLVSIAKSVASECAGLPLAIVATGGSMRGIYELSEWRNALYELRKHIKGVNDIDGQVFQHLRFSYDRLSDGTIQKCFLWCSLFPEDFCIDKKRLIRHWIGDGLLDEIDSIEQQFDLGYAIMNKLINNCLLENVPNKLSKLYDQVKMHDVVRDMALHLMKSIFMVKSGMGIRKLPQPQESPEKLQKVSLMMNEISEITLPVPLSKLRMLTTLLLSHNNISWVPECFFEYFPNLSALDLSCNPIVNLPESICSLHKLKVLLLHSCHLLEKMPPLSALQALEDLDIWRTRINVINLLEAGFKRLKFFLACFVDVQELNSYVVVCLQQGYFPTMYRLGVVKDSFTPLGYQYEVKSRILIEDFDGRNIIILPSNVEELFLWRSNTGKSLSDSICCLKDAIDKTSLQELRDLPGAATIPEPIKTLQGFSSLKSINIWRCAKMKKLFRPKWLLHGLQNLEDLCVISCSEMEELIESDVEGDAIQITLPMLKKLKLADLPELRTICSRGSILVCDHLEQIGIQRCEKLKTIPVSLLQLGNGPASAPPHLLDVTVWTQEWWESVEWYLPNAKNLLAPFVRFKSLWWG